MKLILWIFFGIFLGSTSTFLILKVNEHMGVPNYTYSGIGYRHVLQLAQVKIQPKNYYCEANVGNLVGDVLGNILEANSNHRLNKINEGCVEGRCQMSYSNCAPWQNDGCGSTILSFTKNSSGEINADSFSCLQMP